MGEYYYYMTVRFDSTLRLSLSQRCFNVHFTIRHVLLDVLAWFYISVYFFIFLVALARSNIWPLYIAVLLHTVGLSVGRFGLVVANDKIEENCEQR